ncbi:Similar to Protein disulfide-isomerase erp38; acc. no. Q92249 [Pyronema omphalodes CBS 100304]|uniref:protein disulfide-isomerase n=1 Tax=Pyronema omphalodes (strain CBS 100304) TaxID=1076935 RepID=U4LIL1_PYROM|nr:Similar to Protein disulfide-isomerase erp38; acc. no. Q92249 [Pyronema omphalodes CBS 100304]
MKVYATFLSGLTFVATVIASNVVDLTPKNFDEIILKSGNPSLVEFYAPWCGHCKKLAPTWEELADSFADKKDKITIAKVNGDDHSALTKRYGISGFPTLKYFDGKTDKPIAYDGGRDLESFTEFIGKHSGVKSKGAKPVHSDVVVLTDSNFDTIVNGEKNVLVEFYAPWCGHCKSLAPIYETVATEFAVEDTLIIAKVDANAPTGKATAEKYGITGFPTLKFFPAGSTEPIDYDSGRTATDLFAFLNEKAGTHRAVGGGLTETAGRIAAFDDEVAKLVKGDAESLKTVTEAVEKLAEEAKETYASYYLKALKKVADKEGYVEKEIARLQKMLKGGKIAQKKSDELWSKVNILGQFFKAPAINTKDEL